MDRARAARSGPADLGAADARGIRMHLQHLEQQVHQLRRSIDPQSSPPSTAAAEPVGPITYERVRAIIAARRARERYFKPELFGDPAWDILLELYATELAQHRIIISKLCDAAAVPPTTAFRWIGFLEQEGLVERFKDPLDARKIYIALTEKSRTALRDYFSEGAAP